MGKSFNVEGVCFEQNHYMVNLEKRIEAIRLLIDAGKYFTINKARQYGKTTTITSLKTMLDAEYAIFFISFEGIGDAAYQSEDAFCHYFYGLLYDVFYYKEIQGFSEQVIESCHKKSIDVSIRLDLRELSNFISRICTEAGRPVVLIIDEVDQASNQKIFLDFLGMLRAKYLKRNSRPTFQSIILASVYDIKNLKQKIRSEEEHQYNSPWNIAADFTIEMSFSIVDIMGMLSEYEADYRTGMDIENVAKQIYKFTSGYPYLVSRICKVIDESVGTAEEANGLTWSEMGVVRAVKIISKESSTLFDDIRKKLDDFPMLRKVLEDILFNGSQIPYNQYNENMDIGLMFGFLKESNGTVVIANCIFETFFYNLFISEQALNNVLYQRGDADKRQFVRDGILDMDMVLKKFMEHFTEVYGDSDLKFIEENGRRLFLLYLKPIINGTGNYYIEAQTRDRKRTDVIVDYLGQQYVIELKIWHREEYNCRGEVQLAEYLDAYHVDKGYMISFNFNKNKKAGMHEIECKGKKILEIIV